MATIEIDGNTIEVENGKMIIEVADEQGVYIPRFCYHKKLSVAANCRMCLVEVENSKKTVPACATPVNDGMKIFTKSKAARESQEAVMEFLLINHPLDCPICDQGGECELQDISLGFGKDESKYTETKRAVSDDDLGDLISTEMTRCIQCTRCVRFCDEVAGLPELGGIGRGENMQIGTYVQHNMQSEVSGNIIDLCPVGALTSKPYRFSARAWEMVESASVAPHDCLGSNVLLHTRRNEVMRAVPNENEEINETWLSDRDRFSYIGLNSQNRLGQPMIKNNGKWEEASWQQALDFAASGIMRVLKKHGANNMAAFSSSSATIEEGYLLQKIMRTFGIENLDHRLQQVDFQDQNLEPITPDNDLDYAEIENQNAICVVGCNIDKEIPLLGIRVRKARINGAEISAVNPADYAFKFDISNKAIVSPHKMLNELLKILVAASNGKQLNSQAQKLISGVQVDENSQAIAKSLQADDVAIITGAIAENHPQAALIRTVVRLIAEVTGAKVLRLCNGANSAGLSIAGMLPNRGPAGHSLDEQGLNVQDAIAAKLKGYILHAVEPDFDFANPSAVRQAMLAAEFVISLTAYDTEGLRECSDVMLPIGPYAETSGTFVNLDGTWQSFKGAVKPHAEARPAWKVLRVLGNVLKCDGFEYNSSEDVLSEIKNKFALMTDIKRELYYPEAMPEKAPAGLCRIGEWPLYRIDSIVRNSDALQNCGAAQKSEIRVNSATATKYKLTDNATVSQGDIAITLPLVVDDRIADDAVWVANAMPETVDLGHAYSSITIK